jgi:hypothetical protein
MSEEKKCKKCNETKSFKHIGVMVLGTYILFATIYGTIEIVKNLLTLIK